MAGSVEITYYARTGYSLSDEPESDAIINLNEHWVDPMRFKEISLHDLKTIKVRLTKEQLDVVDYLKARDTETDEHRYFFIDGHRRYNNGTVELALLYDAFAKVGLSNITFFGNVMRRSLTAEEKKNYPLLAEPWAPRRPLKVRRIILDLNVNKSVRIPTHIATNFEETTTPIQATETIDVPNSPLQLTTFKDELSIDALIPMGYPNIASSTSHNITTPWGTIQYTTPYEQYVNISGSGLAIFLANAKKLNALDLIESPYYLPNPQSEQKVIISELSNPRTNNLKASKYYTTITIRSLASNSSRTFADDDTDLEYNQSLTVIVAPDKHGGIYVMPTTLRDTGMNAYAYLEGVYSPFETVVYNAVGDTPAKYAADGTNLLNTALNELYKTYTGKVNALQYEGMRAKYFKDMGAIKGAVMAFASDLLGSISETVTTVDGYDQVANITTNVPNVTQNSTQTQKVPQYTQSQSQSTSVPRTTPSQSTRTTIPQNSTSSSQSTTTPRINTYQGYYNGVTPTYNTNTSYTTPYTSSSSGSSTQGSHTQTSSTDIVNPAHTQTMSGSTTTPAHSIQTDSQATTSGYTQQATQTTKIPKQVTRSTTTQEGSSRSVDQGNTIAENGISRTYNSPAYGGSPTFNLLQTMTFGGYRNEAHSFMLGNINDYLNRWVSLQNDMHNGKVANLFKNVTLVGTYNDYNKLVGKYEIVVASLHPDDEANFDLFLDHFGHAVDEYTDTLVVDAQPNYNYTMVGEDAILANSVEQSASTQILNQFRTGVRVWKTLIRPENY